MWDICKHLSLYLGILLTQSIVVDLAIYGIICFQLLLPTGSHDLQSKILSIAEKSIANGNDLDEVPLSKLFVLDQELSAQDFMLGVAIFLCFFRFLGYLKFSTQVMQTLHLVFLMMSKITIYIVFLFLFITGFALMYWISVMTDLGGEKGLIWIILSQFAQSIGGQDYSAVDDMVTYEWKLCFYVFFILFSVFTVITVMNLVIAVVSAAYEEGVEASASWWAYRQLSNIHEEDFINKDSNPFRWLFSNMWKRTPSCRHNHKKMKANKHSDLMMMRKSLK